jgi:thioredoxin 1
MKKIALLITFITFWISGFSGPLQNLGQSLSKAAQTESTEGITFFNGTWKEALAKAAAEGKYIFLDAYAAWCGPCKVMAKREFVKADVGAFFNKTFINFKMDMEKDVDGRRLGNKYKITAYPTLFIVDSNEEIIKQAIGYHKSKDLIAFGKSAK